MAKSYEEDKKIYDISDRAALLLSTFNKLSKIIDPDNDLPNSLQAVLGKVYRYEGMTQSEIAAIYQSDYQNTIKYITMLHKRGLVKKVPLDAKRKGIYLTEQGKKVNAHLMEERSKLISQAIEIIGDERLITTRETLDDIIGIFEARINEMNEETET